MVLKSVGNRVSEIRQDGKKRFLKKDADKVLFDSSLYNPLGCKVIGCEDGLHKRTVSNSVVQTIPMNLLGRKSCSAEVSTIFEFHLHCTKSEFETVLLCNSSIKVIDNNLRSHTLISKLYLVPPVHAIRLCNRYHVFSVFFRLNQVQFLMRLLFRF